MWPTETWSAGFRFGNESLSSISSCSELYSCSGQGNTISFWAEGSRRKEPFESSICGTNICLQNVFRMQSRAVASNRVTECHKFDNGLRGKMAHAVDTGHTSWPCSNAINLQLTCWICLVVAELVWLTATKPAIHNEENSSVYSMKGSASVPVTWTIEIGLYTISLDTMSSFSGLISIQSRSLLLFFHSCYMLVDLLICACRYHPQSVYLDIWIMCISFFFLLLSVVCCLCRGVWHTRLEWSYLCHHPARYFSGHINQWANNFSYHFSGILNRMLCALCPY